MFLTSGSYVCVLHGPGNSHFDFKRKRALFQKIEYEPENTDDDAAVCCRTKIYRERWRLFGLLLRALYESYCYLLVVLK